MTRSPIPEIVNAVADAKGTDPYGLDLSLQEYVDTDALQLLADHDTASWRLSFQLPNHEVTVTGDGVVLVDGIQKEIWT